MNKTISRYLSKNILFPSLVESMPDNEVGIIIVIPCFNEPDIQRSILSISHCTPPKCKVEVLVSINAGKSDSSDIKQTNIESEQTIISMQSQLPEWLSAYSLLHQNLPDKKAGVGLGRKIGMDEAVRRFMETGHESGIIVCFDADSTCDVNYLVEIERQFEESDIESTSINYEHPIEGNDFSQEIFDSIIQYELHLRYFIRMQKQINLPYAFHTVGSSMACTVSAYCAVGGMNQKKAGEDFYFIHKLVKFGKHSELNTTRVIPSPRISDRVPFGTGRAIGEMQQKDAKEYFTYHPQSFSDLGFLVRQLPEIYKNGLFGSDIPLILNDFLERINGDSQLERIIKNTSDFESFRKMFWHWFDAFTLMKYLHYARDQKYSNIPVLLAVRNVEHINFNTAKDALVFIRKNDLLQ